MMSSLEGVFDSQSPKLQAAIVSLVLYVWVDHCLTSGQCVLTSHRVTLASDGHSPGSASAMGVKCSVMSNQTC